MSLLERVDSLWSSGGVAFTDYLQRPDTEIVPNDEDPLHGGILILIHDDSGDIRFQLEDGTLKPIGYIRVETEMLTVERRVFSERRAHGLYPTRVVDLTTFQDGTGYTEVVDFDLAPLEPESPVSKPFSADSFRNPGSGYQVYRLMREGEELAERVEGPGTSNTSGLAVRDGSRSWFLWANTAVIAAIVLVILARRFRRK